MTSGNEGKAGTGSHILRYQSAWCVWGSLASEVNVPSSRHESGTEVCQEKSGAKNSRLPCNSSEENRCSWQHCVEMLGLAFVEVWCRQPFEGEMKRGIGA